MLKILSILLIIGAVLSLIMCLVVAIGGNAASDTFNFTQLGTSVTLSALLGVFHLGAGIFGLKSIKDPNKEVLKNCMLCGILLLVGDIASCLISMAASGFNIYAIIGLLFPALYLVAVINYKKSVIE
ncbi:hypothetical protein [uncultured Anaerofustis sp.]|uniref:hypothetical protein n=1 Tax=uncultured Anaerofustis sp. TaxID=904996 RepID=UPI0025E94E63|nr:hypothetical protein [uncultured Anaerofustis sp.]